MPTDLENWHKAFEMIGPEMLRLRMELRRGEYDGAYGRAAEEWLLKKKAGWDRSRSRRCSCRFFSLVSVSSPG